MKNGHAPLAILAVMAFALMLPAAAEEKPTAPLRPHMGQVMFPYPPLNAVVMFGARAEDPAPASRPWKWNGREWEAFAGEAPAFHYWNAMAYDSRRQRLVAFGGKDKKQKGYGDFWEWDGGKWSAIAARSCRRGGRTSPWPTTRRGAGRSSSAGMTATPSWATPGSGTAASGAGRRARLRPQGACTP